MSFGDAFPHYVSGAGIDQGDPVKHHANETRQLRPKPLREHIQLPSRRNIPEEARPSIRTPSAHEAVSCRTIECSVRGVQHELLVEGATLGNKQFLPALELRAQYIRLATNTHSE